jgi:hypothetical protein
LKLAVGSSGVSGISANQISKGPVEIKMTSSGFMANVGLFVG